MDNETGANGLESESARLEREMNEVMKRWAGLESGRTNWEVVEFLRGLHVAVIRDVE